MNKQGRDPARKSRARDLGIAFDGEPGEFNGITDVAGVEVGYATLIRGEGALQRGHGPVRTGVTGILPRGRAHATTPVFAATFALNGNGELTGSHWIEESGACEGPITITAVVESTEEAIIDSMVANETMIGRDGLKVVALPHDRLMELCRI